MQVFGLHKSIYKLNRCVSPEESFLSPRIENIREQLKTWNKLKNHSVPDLEIAQITGMSRSSFYRHKKAISIYGFKGLEIRSKRPNTLRQSTIHHEVISLILKLRQISPTYGKAKITVLLRRDHGVVLSESSVGRIITKLIAQGKIKRSISSIRIKRKRKFTSHAKRWEYGMKAENPGQLVQIDHMSVIKHNLSMKEFSAWDPITKVMVSDVVSNASSSAAAKFLRKVVQAMPFPIRSIQVDGGSEFMKYFEEECKKLGIALFVLPPSRPQWNGGVERSNRIFREEFYARSDIQAESLRSFRYELQKAVHKYNTYRPHYSLKGKTPYEYTKEILGVAC